MVRVRRTYSSACPRGKLLCASAQRVASPVRAARSGERRETCAARCGGRRPPAAAAGLQWRLRRPARASCARRLQAVSCPARYPPTEPA
eukprot:scaffold13447_cov57-Phaeocystis_antarctica.AAC.4